MKRCQPSFREREMDGMLLRKGLTVINKLPRTQMPICDILLIATFIVKLYVQLIGKYCNPTAIKLSNSR
jgi:hypothetical protein